MKKKFFFAAVALVALASCSSDDFVGENNNSPNLNPAPASGEKAIVFNSGANAITRATWTGEKAADMLNNNFKFLGTKTVSTSSTVFDHYNAYWTENTANTTESNSNDWEYVGFTPDVDTDLPSGATQSIKYWDYAATQYDFAAYSLGKGVTSGGSTTYADASKINLANKGGTTTPVYTLTGTVAQLKECYISDLVTAYNIVDGTDPSHKANTFGQVVTFSFRSLASKIRIAFYETVPGYSVKDIEFYNKVDADASTPSGFGSSASLSTTPSLLAADDAASLPTQDLDGSASNQTLNVFFETVGWANAPENAANTAAPKTDYNKAHVALATGGTKSASLTFGNLSDFTNAERFETADDYIGRASNASTYAGGIDPETGAGKYYTILPSEAGVDLMIRVKYTLVSTDGSNEVINVDNATAVIPSELASWKPNYAYTYIFKISDMTNGTTGVDQTSGNPVMGLTPITLNAVVVDSEDGIQETITTVSDPSITTYMAGKVVTDNDEYKGSTTHPIYIVVNDGSDNVALTVGTNAQLYTAELVDPNNSKSAINPISEESVDNALRYGVLESGKTVATSSTFTVTDANGWNLVVTKVSTGATDVLTGGVTAIPATESPTGDAVSLTCASFVPQAPASGTKYYIFQYKGNASGAYGTYTAVAPAKLPAGSYFTLGVTEHTATGSETTGTTYYRKEGDNYVEVSLPLTVNAKYYTLAATAHTADGSDDIVKTTRYYTTEDNYVPVTSALTAGTYYYYDSSTSSYVAYSYNGSSTAPVRPYYTKRVTYKAVEYGTLSSTFGTLEPGVYYTSDRGAGKFTVKSGDVVYVDEADKYFTKTVAEVDAKYMYKIIKVVP